MITNKLSDKAIYNLRVENRIDILLNIYSKIKPILNNNKLIKMNKVKIKN